MTEPVSLDRSPELAPRRRRGRAALGAAALGASLGAAAPQALADHRPAPPFMIAPFISAVQEPHGTAVTARIYAGISGFRLICGECTGRGEEERARNLDGRLHAALLRRESCPADPPGEGGGDVLRAFMGPRGEPSRPIEHGYHELETVLRLGSGRAGDWIVCAWFEYERSGRPAIAGPFTERTERGIDRVTVRRAPPAAAGGLPLSAAQLQIDQRIAQAALRRAAALEARLDGRPAPEPPAGAGSAPIVLSARQLQINQRISQAAVRRANTLEARLDGLPAPTRPAGREPRPVTLSARQLQINQRISQAAVRRLNLLEARLAP